jgi:hypothetical protein
MSNPSLAGLLVFVMREADPRNTNTVVGFRIFVPSTIPFMYVKGCGPVVGDATKESPYGKALTQGDESLEIRNERRSDSLKAWSALTFQVFFCMLFEVVRAKLFT